MRRMVISYGTGDFLVGMRRLEKAVFGPLGEDASMMGFGDWSFPDWTIPASWPTHQQKPFAFKAYALKAAMEAGADLLLWCDCCILPIRSLEPLWERIERDGYWMSRNGFSNYEWTADSAYPDLFSNDFASHPDLKDNSLEANIRAVKLVNRTIEHVVAGCFGINVRHPIGKAFLEEYYRLASETYAFCGPWTNTSRTPCGPPDVRGHRHDQTAASVIAWRLGMKLTSPPNIFAYSKRRADKTLHLEDQDQSTILLADGSMHDGNVL